MTACLHAKGTERLFTSSVVGITHKSNSTQNTDSSLKRNLIRLDKLLLFLIIISQLLITNIFSEKDKVEDESALV